MIKLDYYYGNPRITFTTAAGIDQDDTFITAVFMSLLTNARVEVEEALDPEDLGGWWGNSYSEVEGWQLGSKLWLLAGRKITADTLAAAVQYAEEALAWMREDGISDTVEVVAKRVSADEMDLEIYIERPEAPADKWLGTWDATIEAVN